MFSADGVLQNFFLFGDSVWRHSKHCRLVSGSGVGPTFLPLTTRERKPQLHIISIHKINVPFCTPILHSWYWVSTDVGKAEIFNDCHFIYIAPPPKVWWGTIYLLLGNNLRTIISSTRRMLWRYSASVTTPISSWITATPVSAYFICRPHRRTALTSTAASPDTKQMFEDSNRFFTF